MLKFEKESLYLPQYLVFSDTSVFAHNFYFNCISLIFKKTEEIFLYGSEYSVFYFL